MASNDFYTNLVGEMCQLWVQGELCDITLSIEDTLIPAHRVVLAALSPYFKAMFCCHLDERRRSTINILDLKSAVVKTIVEFAYTGKLNLKEDSVQTIMQTAAMMQILPIVKLCSQFLSDCLHPSNCLGIRDFAKRMGCSDLMVVADKYCEENFSEVSQEEEFVHLDVDEIIGLIIRDTLKVAKEEEVYSAVMRWVEYDPERKKGDAVRIMEHVRLPLVQWDFLIKEVSQDKLFVQNEECRNYLQQARAFQASSFHPDLINFALNEAVIRSHPRTSFSSTDRLYSVGGETVNRQNLCLFESFNPMTGQAAQLPDLPEAKRSLAVAVLDNIIYAIGGAIEYQSCRSVHAFDIEKQQWRSRGQLCVARSSVVAMVVTGEIKVFGGYGENGVLSSVEKYDEEFNSWSLVSEMMEPRSMAAAAVIGDRLFLCGGYDGHVDLMSCHMLDNKTMQWFVCSNLLEARSMHGAAALGGKMYVAGGCNQNECLSSVEMYDPDSNQWTSVQPLLGPRRGIGLSVIGEALYAAGGHDSKTFQNTIMKYNSRTRDWSSIGHLITKRGRFGFL